MRSVFSVFVMSACKGDNQFHIVLRGALLSRTSRLISAHRSAYGAFVDYYIAFFRVGLGAHRLHHPAAAAGAVSRIFVKMAAPKTIGTMIAGGVAEGLYRFSAMPAHKA